jgi:hypothetical protein
MMERAGMHQDIHLRCRLCGRVFPGWLPVQNEPDGAMLVHHLSAMHPTEVGPYLRRMATEDIGSVAMEAFERVMSELESASWIPGPSAALAMCLASDQARSISGQTFPIEGDSPSSDG